MHMTRWMCGVSLRGRKTSDELSNILGLEPVLDIIRRDGLKVAGHVLRKHKNNWVRRVMDIDVEGSRPRGRPKKTWIYAMEEDMCPRELMMEDAMIEKNGEDRHG